MIKTVQYNDFSEISIDVLYDKKLLIEELKNFHKNNGNLNYDIKADSYEKLVPAEKWMRERLKDPEIINDFFENGYLESPFKWHIEDNKIIENPLYGGYWFRDNKDFYVDYMNNGMTELLTTLSQENIEPNAYIETNYNKQLTEINYQHPIIYLANKLGNHKIYDLIFTMKPEYKKLWLENSFYKKNQPNYIYSIGLNQSGIINSEIAKVFYEHNIIKDFLHHPENIEHLMSIIKAAITENDIDFVKKYINDWDIPTIEKNQERSYCFLSGAKSKEMAEILLKQGAFVMGQLKPTDKYETTIFPSENFKNQEVIKTILNFKEEYRDIVVTNSKAVFDRYFNSANDELIKMFINEYNFPVKKYDLLVVGRNMHGTDGINWALKLGADIRNCNDLITACIRAREDGLSFLKKVHKEGSFNAFQPDSIHNVLQGNPTKIFYTWLSKASREDFTGYTKEGNPAWWTTNLSSIEFIKTKVKDFNQLSEKGNNFFHYIFNISNVKADVINSIINTTKISEEELSIMLNQKNKEGITSMETVIQFLKVADKQKHYSEIKSIVALINLVQDNIDFNIVTKTGKTVYEELTTIFPTFDELHIYCQKHNLEKKIPQKSISNTTKLKI